MAARKRKKPPPKRATRSLLSRVPSLPRPTIALEPHHVDIIGLGMIAVGILLGGVAYAHWDGGALGNGAITGLRFVLGALGYVVPAALVLAGGLVLMRELRPPGRPLRTGVICLTCAITLALAAGTLGVGPGAVPASQFWHAAAFETRGGIVGPGRAVGHIASGLDARRRHPRGVPVRRRADSGDRSDARGNRADDRRRSRRHHAGAPALHRGNGRDSRPAARHRSRSRPGTRAVGADPAPGAGHVRARGARHARGSAADPRRPRRPRGRGARARASGPGARGCARGRRGASRRRRPKT